jgi:hypothetical protein
MSPLANAMHFLQFRPQGARTPNISRYFIISSPHFLTKANGWSPQFGRQAGDHRQGSI